MEIVKQVIGLILSLLSKEDAKELIDTLLDKVEDKIAATENKIDDAVVLPLINKVREILDVPDGDD